MPRPSPRPRRRPDPGDEDEEWEAWWAEDRQRLAVFRTFLRETPSGAVMLRDLAHASDYFPTRPEFERWRNRWLPYLVGLADGPCTPEQYAALRPRLYGQRRRETDEIDRFHAQTPPPDQ